MRACASWAADHTAARALLALTCLVPAGLAVAASAGHAQNSATTPVVTTPAATTPVATTPVANTPPTTPAPTTPFATTTPAPPTTSTTPTSQWTPTTPTLAPEPPPIDPAADGNWTLPDRLAARLDVQWNEQRGLYVDRGAISIRANAMLLELHALAALAGHTGPARNDARIAPLVHLFTTAPVVVYATTTERSIGSFPHVPAWESAYRSDPTRAALHPSADAIIARALETAWRARLITNLDVGSVQAIQTVVGAVAHSPSYKAPNRAENQINWNTDVYEANLIVNDDRSDLPDYRAHLRWFIDHAFKPAYKNGSGNLSAGYGFRYIPQFAGGNANKVDTVEYANLVHSALGFYQTAVLAGMPPLERKEISGLNEWTRHILFGTWTDAGYLNWDTGLNTARRHVRQYWAFALDSLVRSSGPGALIANANQRAYVKHVVEQALDLFSRTAWNGEGPLPAATEFDAPNGFPDSTRSPLITPLRFAVVAAELDVRLPATTSLSMGNTFSQDSEYGRLAVSTPSYNLAIIKPVAQGEGGLEPTRLFDGEQRPLTTLGAGGFGGPAPGLALGRGDSIVLDDQPGTQRFGQVPGMSVATWLTNQSEQFTGTLSAFGTVRAGTADIAVNHRFGAGAIQTTYHVARGSATNVTMRMPVWGQGSQIDLIRGAALIEGRLHRTSGAILMRGTTAGGGEMLVSFRNVPARATIVIVRHGSSARAPDGARELRIRFKAAAQMTLLRRIAIVTKPAAAAP